MKNFNPKMKYFGMELDPLGPFSYGIPDPCTVGTHLVYEIELGNCTIVVFLLNNIQFILIEVRNNDGKFYF